MVSLQTLVPLQTSPPEPGTAVAALVGLVLIGAVVGTAGNALVRRLSNPVGKYRLLYAGVLFPVTLLSYGLLALLGFGPANRSRSTATTSSRSNRASTTRSTPSVASRASPPGG